jgi:hypothetical protein
MPKRKVLKSVARSEADSFTSLMNYAEDDYVLGHILNLARTTGKTELSIDLLSGEAGPEELLAHPVGPRVAWYVQGFEDLVSRSGSDPALVSSAILELKFDTSVSHTRMRSPEPESPYVCTVRIVDDRGKTYESRLTGWWYPEKSPKDSRRGRKGRSFRPFWARRD